MEAVGAEISFPRFQRLSPPTLHLGMSDGLPNSKDQPWKYELLHTYVIRQYKWIPKGPYFTAMLCSNLYV
mgnify:CR=1 FL=1|jgi:hypothetical protein